MDDVFLIVIWGRCCVGGCSSWSSSSSFVFFCCRVMEARYVQRKLSIVDTIARKYRTQNLPPIIKPELAREAHRP